MKLLHAALGLFLATSCVSDHSPKVPFRSGTYQFEHRDAEFSGMRGFPVTVTIDGLHYDISAKNPRNPAVMCQLYEGTFMWNQKVHKWVLGNDESDRTAEEAGGCQEHGPDVIDFKKRIVWTCYGDSIVTEACSNQSK